MSMVSAVLRANYVERAPSRDPRLRKSRAALSGIKESQGRHIAHSGDRDANIGRPSRTLEDASSICPPTPYFLGDVIDRCVTLTASRSCSQRYSASFNAHLHPVSKSRPERPHQKSSFPTKASFKTSAHGHTSTTSSLAIAHTLVYIPYVVHVDTRSHVPGTATSASRTPALGCGKPLDTAIDTQDRILSHISAE